MNLCANKHDEVCYDGSFCPVCVEIEIRDDEIDKLKDQIDGYKQEIKELTED